MGKEVKILTSLVSDSRAGLRKANEGFFLLAFLAIDQLFQKLEQSLVPLRLGYSLQRMFIGKETYLILRLPET